jgi:hypothetical protein
MKKNYISIIILAVALITAISIYATSKDKSSNKRKAITNSTKQIAVNDSQELKNKNVPQKKLKNKIQTFHIYKALNKYEGIIGNFKNNKSDNPSDNIFHITIDKDLSLNTSVYLEYELYGLQDYTSVCRSVNDQLTTGGYFVKKSEGWSKQSEQLSIKQLKQGKNIIRFTVPENAEYAYKVRNVCLIVKPAVRNESRRLVVNQPNTFTFFQKFGYLQGFVSGKGSENAQLKVNDKSFSNNNGNFEGLVEKSTLDSNVWKATVTATFEDGMQLKTEVNYQQSVEYDYTYNFNNHIKQSLQQAEPEKEINFIHEGLQLSGKAQSVKTNVQLSATSLRSVDMPPMGSGMVNVTGESKGYRLLPHGTQFENELKLAIKYDTTLLPKGYRASDIRTYYFDEKVNNWVIVPIDTIDKTTCMVISRTNHFSDYINAIIKVPELPETQAFTPTSLKDIKAANPIAGLNIISPPSANNMGTANISFPIEIPPGRQGMQPNLALQYNSAGGNGWMGMGWDLSIPSITVETRWGVPTYRNDVESEDYLIAGEQIAPALHEGNAAPLVHRAIFVARDTAQTKQYVPRIEGAFNKIIRHGTNPKNYWWTVTDRNGITYYYGKYLSRTFNDTLSRLCDDNGNIAHWALTETHDLNGNFIQYQYDTIQNTGLAQGTVKGRQIYIKKILYTNYNNESDGKYSVEFERENNDVYRRPDMIISGRYGFKEVTAHLLKRIRVKYINEVIRKYTLIYHEGAFYKNLLCGIFEENQDSPFLNTTIDANYLVCNPGIDIIKYKGTKRHSFDYYDDINQTHFTSPTSLSIDEDDESTGIIGFVDVSPIGATRNYSPSVGGGLNVGLGNKVWSKSMSGGGNYNYSYSKTEGIVALVDIDGDGLPDKVFKENDTLWYRKLKQDMLTFDDKKELFGAPQNFMTEVSKTNTWGMEGHLGWSILSLNASGNYPQTESYTSTYFADANGDGLLDIIGGGIAYLNQLQNGIPHFVTTTSDTVYIGDNACEYIIHTGTLNDSIAINKDDDDKPTKFFNLLNESVRLWIAPYDGTININSSVQLIKDTSFARTQSHYVDGIRYTIQHNNNELIFDSIQASNYISKAVNYSNLGVSKGDYFYFRLQSQNNRSYDNINWDPKITYIGQDTNKCDADGKSIYSFKASDDFLLNAKNIIAMPLKGKTIIRGNLTAPALTDTLRFQIYKNNVLYKEKVFNHSTAINYSLDTLIDVDTNDIFTFFARTNTTVNWTAVNSKFKMFYVFADSVSIDTTSIYKSINFNPIVYYNLYQENILPSNPYSLATGYTYTAIPSLQYSGNTGINSNYITLAIKKNNQLIAKKHLPYKTMLLLAIQIYNLITLQVEIFTLNFILIVMFLQIKLQMPK